MSDQRTMLTAATDRLDRLMGSFERPSLFPTQKLLLLSFLCVVFLGMQWVRITGDDSITGLERLFFDGSRYLVALLAAMVAYSIWPMISSVPAHNEALTRFARDAASLQNQVSEKSDIALFQQSTHEQLEAILIRAYTLIITELNVSSCRLTLKILVSPTDASDGYPRVFTLLRDPASRDSGSEWELGRPFSYKENTAFTSIIDEERSYFASSNLQGLASERKYLNANPNWKRLYNSTIVVPIKSMTEKSTNGMIGFLCIDSLYNVNHDWVRRRLVYYADLIYNVFQVLYQFCGTRDHSRQTVQYVGWKKSGNTVEPFDARTQGKIEIVLDQLARIGSFDSSTPAVEHSASNTGDVMEDVSGEEALVASPVSEMKMKDENVLEDTRKLLLIISTAPLAQLVGLEGKLQFPRPTLEELELLATNPSRLRYERRMVIEAYEERLAHNKAAEAELSLSDQALDKKIAQMFSA